MLCDVMWFIRHDIIIRNMYKACDTIYKIG